MKADLRLYALVDPEHMGRHDIAELAAAVARGGATLVQLRDKKGTTREMVARARAIHAALAGSGVPLLINDRVDVALAAGAEGVHIGWDDMEAADARRLLGPDAVIGLSINSAERARTAPLDLIDYVCTGGVFATTSKDNPNPPQGVPGVAVFADIIRARAPKGFPVGAIAGITAANAGDVIAGGLDGIAVITALSLQENPEAAARNLRRIVDRALATRAAA